MTRIAALLLLIIAVVEQFSRDQCPGSCTKNSSSYESARLCGSQAVPVTSQVFLSGGGGGCLGRSVRILRRLVCSFIAELIDHCEAYSGADDQKVE